MTLPDQYVLDWKIKNSFIDIADDPGTIWFNVGISPTISGHAENEKKGNNK